MRVNLVCVEDGIISVGFRKMVSYARLQEPDTHGYFVALNNNLSLINLLTGKYGEAKQISSKLIEEIAEPLAQGDIVGFSSMTGYAELTKKIILKIQAINPKIYVLWGGDSSHNSARRCCSAC